jgi:hypothetical protein
MCIAVLALVSLLPAPAGASQVRDLSLTQMAQAAGPVFSGRVLSVKQDEVRGWPVTRVTFQVADSLRDAPGATTTLTFLGNEKTGQFSRKVPGMPTFSVGEDWVVLAYPPSEVGLTAPVGLYQGAFRVQNPAAGDLREGAGFTVMVPATRRAILREMKMQASPVAPEGGLPAGATVSYDAFMRQLRDLTGAGPSARVMQPDTAASGTDLETAAAAAARGTGRQR